MYEDPPRLFETREECDAAASIKAKATMEMLTDEGEFTVEHFEVGCEEVNQICLYQQSLPVTV